MAILHLKFLLKNKEDLILKLIQPWQILNQAYDRDNRRELLEILANDVVP
jgi:hypothetical protein